MNVPELLTFSQLARRADCAPMTLARLVAEGVILPDYQSGDMRLFKPGKLQLLRVRLHPEASLTDTHQT